MKTRLKQLGQGMTEYIIIVALIAIVAITVFNIFGDTVRGQVGNMAAELGGGTGTTNANLEGEANTQGASGLYSLDDFEQTEN
ncbi:MAG: hypothetical protein COA90_08400 [Gammaproteobacteria bacterium]|nr:MAG: hypothetical protein COA90_08400 [Gammaproteobacteria bacterium]